MIWLFLVQDVPEKLFDDSPLFLTKIEIYFFLLRTFFFFFKGMEDKPAVKLYYVGEDKNCI